jgi:undecaprenyl diphosphate synthase
MKTPNHVAIIMDGNGRWAEMRRRPRIYGHIRGSNKVRPIVRECGQLGIKFLTLYAFSSENWGRPSGEVNILMRLLAKYLAREQKTLMKENVRFKTIGQIEQLPQFALDLIRETEAMTAQNTGLTLVFALSYGARPEITLAAQKIAEEVKAGTLSPSEITPQLFQKYLFSGDWLPDPDLIIRTRGEMRLSNFLLWQSAYTEIFVTDTLWPDFSTHTLHGALEDYAGRQRKFGLTSKQTERLNSLAPTNTKPTNQPPRHTEVL